MYHEIDIIKLIKLVETQPVIWNKTMEFYKYKLAHEIAWKEICIALNDGYDDMSEEDRRDFGKEVVKRWNSVRDSWLRCHKKLVDHKLDGNEAEQVYKYKYYENMEFLARIATYRANELSLVSPHESTEDIKVSKDSKDNEIPKDEIIKNNVGTVTEERETPNVSITNEDAHKEKHTGDRRLMDFFKSIAPKVAKFDDDALVEFQFEVIRTMREISQRSRTSFVSERNMPSDSPQPEENGDLGSDEDRKDNIIFDD